MNCKPGDIAKYIGDKPNLIGMYFICEELRYWHGRPYWYVSPKVPNRPGIYDFALRPIRPSDEQDEMLRIVGLPNKEKEKA